MDKQTRNGIIILIGIIIFMAAAVVAAYFIGRANTGDSSGIGEYQRRERELLDRIGEYEQRERDRIAAENQRIERERARIARTQADIDAVRGLNRRSGDGYAQIIAECDILEDYFSGSCSQYGDDANNSGSE